ncbi:methionyl-tRNA synthetase [Dorcoceras hygrometricum]|uniref:Methionyl-tRNA synthetase n=1 Tax=Dorcoceras hygrometricum TaxID=472368 RepID=A0A2Z7BID8_9LAMI|nr:methionyl-tRNA synthetase [Dorcoceras hygrometricum]
MAAAVSTAAQSFLRSCDTLCRLHLGLVKIDYHGRLSSVCTLTSNGFRILSSSSSRRTQCHCTEQARDNSKPTGAATSTLESAGKEGHSKNVMKEVGNTLDIRVGRIVKVWRHEEADSLYVEEVDVGEPELRTICSGLVNYIPIHLLQDRNVIVLANLKPRNMRGVRSSGMLLAASDETHEKVELLVPPEAAVPGERVWFGSEDDKDILPDIASPNQVQKKKIWELVQPHLRTNESCMAMLGLDHMRTSAGVVFSESLRNAKIS